MHYYNVGKIINTHGIKGEVKVEPTTDFPKQRFHKGSVLYLVDSVGRKALTVDNARTQMQDYLLHFKGYDSINDVQFMKQKKLQVGQNEMKAQRDLRPGEYYYHQILGLDVYDTDGRHLGKIVHIMKTGANDVWVVSRPQKGELLLPKIKQVIKKVDLKHHSVTVQLMKGMD